MSILLTEIYDVTLKKEIRGAAKNGFVRPTIGEMFMTHRDFEGIPSGLTGKIKSIGDPFTFSTSTATLYINSITMPENKVIVSCRNGGTSGSPGLAVVGDVTNKEILWGSAASKVYPENWRMSISMVPIDATRFFVFYMGDDGKYVYYILCTVTDNIISFGSEQRYYGTSDPSIDLLHAEKLNDTQICMTYANYTTDGVFRLGTTNGASLTTLGPKITYTTLRPYTPNLVRIDDTRMLITYAYTKSKIATVIGANVSFGTQTSIPGGGTRNPQTILLDIDRVITVNSQNVDPFYGIFIIGNINNNLVSWEDYIVFNESSTGSMSVAKMSDKHVYICYVDINTTQGKVVGVTVESNNSVSFGTPYVFTSDIINSALTTTKVNDTHLCVSYRNSSGRGVSKIIEVD